MLSCQLVSNLSHWDSQTFASYGLGLGYVESLAVAEHNYQYLCGLSRAHDRRLLLAGGSHTKDYSLVENRMTAKQ